MSKDPRTDVPAILSRELDPAALAKGIVKREPSDERTANNVMRHEYRILDDHEKAQMKIVKDFGLHFILKCDNLGQSRELSLAKTKIEEAVFWAVKHITR